MIKTSDKCNYFDSIALKKFILIRKNRLSQLLYFVKSNLCPNGPSIVYGVKSQCKKPSIVGIDRTCNLEKLFVAVTSYKHSGIFNF